MADITIRTSSAPAAKEIKATAHYYYVLRGITLDGSKFPKNGLVTEGVCLAKNDATGFYEQYPGDEEDGTFKVGYSNPMILDESVKFRVNDEGDNPNVTVGQCLVHGAVHESLLTGCTEGFKNKLVGAVRFV